MFGTPADFLKMVAEAYQAVYRPHEVTYADLIQENDRLVQRVLFTKSDDKRVLAFYMMARQPDRTWRIAGCVLIVDTVCIASYDHKDYGEINVLKPVDGDGAGWLIVDDLVDTGRTARVVRKMLPQAHFATIYAKPAGRPLVDTFVTEVSQDTWILFPWDVELAYAAPIRDRS